MKRRGVSLVELMVVMSACVVVLTLSAELIHRVMHIQSRTASVVGAERSAQRLAAAFRRDVQDATRKMDEVDEKTLLRLAVDSEEVEYRQDGVVVERLVRQAETIRAREQFVFPQEIDVQIDEQASGLITLSLESRIDAPRQGNSDSPSQAFVTPVHCATTALLSRNARFAAESTSEVSP